MKKRRIVFLILHYMDTEITRKCTEFVENNIDIEDYAVVIVDNGSDNNSFFELNSIYESNNSIEVVSVGKNSFSKGINAGIDYIRKNYWFDYLIVQNNDAYMLETSLWIKLNSYYSKCHFAVAGPNIIDSYGKGYNPISDDDISLENIDHHIKKAKRNMEIWTKNYLYLFAQFLEFKHTVYVMLHKEEKRKTECYPKENVILHGSFWIFSNLFFDCFNGLYPMDSFFVEENILNSMIGQAGLKSIYIPDILVVHLGDASTNKTYKRKYAKRRFLAINTYLSLIKYRELLKLWVE